MCEGEFESLKAMHAVVPTFIPAPIKWGELSDKSGHFIFTEFREVGQQPPDVPKFTMRLAELHESSISPTGKFGFHVTVGPTFYQAQSLDLDCLEQLRLSLSHAARDNEIFQLANWATLIREYDDRPVMAASLSMLDGKRAGPRCS